MDALALILQLFLGFAVGTVVLWLCALTTDSDHATLKTALIYNGIMMCFEIVFLVGGFFFVAAPSEALGAVLIGWSIFTLLIAFVLLMRLYAISFLSTLWIFAAMWAVQTGAEKLLHVVLRIVV